MLLAALPHRSPAAGAIETSQAVQEPRSATSQFLPLVGRWSVETSAPPSAPPVIVGDLVLLPLTPSGIVAYRVADGTLAWRVDLAAVRPLSVDEERAYIVSRDGMRALRAATGEEIWRAETGNLTAPPLVHGGWVVLATAENVSALRASDGAVVWRRSFGTVEASPAIDGDWLFVPLLLETRIVAVDLQTGDKRWEQELGGSPDEPLALGGFVYTFARDKYFYALDARSGEIAWNHRIGAAPRGAPAADADHVYFVGLDNVLHAFDRGDGGKRWRKELAYRPSRGPMLIGTAIVVPGAVMSLPVFGRSGTELTTVKFGATMAGLSNAVPGPFGYPSVAVANGDLQHAWTLSLLESSLDPPPIPLAPLTAPPGVAIAIAPPA